MAARIGPLVGAIRWTAYTSDRTLFTTTFVPGTSASRIFTDFGHRAPVLWDNFSLWGSGVNTQAIVDSEILAAAPIGRASALDFWMYNWYPWAECFVGDPSNKPLQGDIMIVPDAHHASPHKDRVKVCYMIDPGWWKRDNMPLTNPQTWAKVAAYRAALVTRMQDSCYLRVGGRPVIGVYGYASLSSPDKTTWLAEIDALNAALAAVSIGPVHILIADFNTTAGQDMGSYGARWRTTYGPNPGPSLHVNGTQYPWSNMAADDISHFTSIGLAPAPSLSPVNDSRPRSPGAWWMDQPTMPEWQRHCATAFTFIQSGGFIPEIAMVYGQDEIDEGGPGIAPTAQERRRYYDAMTWARTGIYPESYLYELDAAQLNFTQTGSWTQSAQTAGMFNGDELTSVTTGDKVEFTHERCRHLGWLVDKGPDRGIANIYISENGGAFTLAGTADLYSPTVQHQQQVFMSSRLSGGTCATRFEVSGTKNASSSSNKVGPDACRIVYNP